MTTAVIYAINQATKAEIAEHLTRCDADFAPPLSSRVDISTYTRKIASKATRFEAWSNHNLIALVAAYVNDDEEYIAYITSVSVLPEWTGKGIAKELVNRCIEYAKALGMRQVSLEVAEDNLPAVRLYGSCGFFQSRTQMPFISMDRLL